MRIGNVEWPGVSFNNSGMNREVHVPLCERLAGRFRRPTRLFAGNARGAKTAALLYSLIQSCKLNGINARQYLNYILKQVHKLRRGELDAVSLLPQFIDKKLLL